MTLRFTPLAGLLLLAGCSGGGGEEDGGTEDAGPEDAVVEADGPSVELENTFRVDVEGSGSVRVGSVVLADDAGSLHVLGSNVPSVAYEITEWESTGYTLFHVLSPRADTLNVLYLYCEGDVLSWIWHESYAEPMDFESSTGSCDYSLVSTTVDVSALETLLARPSSGQLVDGFTLAGASLSYSSGPGRIVLAGREHDLYPFEAVDCTTDCTADPADGWWELHSIMASPDGRLCFGVLYLMVANTTQVQVGYPVCLDPVEHLADEFLEADWTSAPGGGGGSLAAGPRHSYLGHVLRPLPPSLRDQ